MRAARSRPVGGSALSPWTLAGVAACAALAAVAALATGADAAAILDPTGPIEQIHVSRVLPLDCQVMLTGITYSGVGTESDGEFWGTASPAGPNACGTFLRVGGTTYGPNVGGFSCPWNCGNPTPTAYAPVSQATSGSGTAADPWTIVTEVLAAGDVGIVQTDTYVSGDGHYTTHLAVTNLGASRPFSVYRGGDCYLEDVAHGDTGDQSYGWLDPAGGGAACTFSPHVLGQHHIGFFPDQPSHGAVQGRQGWWYDIWGFVGAGLPMGNACLCTINLDSGAGLGWSFDLESGQTATLSVRNGFVGPPEPIFDPLPPPPVQASHPAWHPVPRQVRAFQPPQAAFTATSACDALTLDASGSTDPDGEVVAWSWDLGDGVARTGRTLTLAPPPTEPFRVVLLVRDDTGLAAPREQKVTWEPCAAPADPAEAPAKRDPPPPDPPKQTPPDPPPPPPAETTQTAPADPEGTPVVAPLADDGGKGGPAVDTRTEAADAVPWPWLAAGGGLAMAAALVAAWLWGRRGSRSPAAEGGSEPAVA